MENIKLYFAKSKYNISKKPSGQNYRFVIYYRGQPYAEITKSDKKYDDILKWWNNKDKNKLTGFIRHTINRVIKEIITSKLKCNKCKETDRRLFDFDHLGNKSFTISQAITRCQPERLIKELLKTQILCVKCHRIKTLKQTNSHSARSHFTIHKSAEESLQSLLLGGNI